MSKIGIKFNKGGKVYLVETDKEFQENDQVVVETIRGLEIAYVSVAKGENADEEIKTIVRKATAEDLKKNEDNVKQEGRVIKLTNELIAKYNLEMKLVDVQFTLDGSKVVINYVCEDRVDFRELVKDLASNLKIRIELRQIGIRDQAKIIGGIGFCGKECCCKQYLNDFDKVSIKMAKTQGLSLNPTKISGICGRLMCCLAYENDLYAELSKNMPKLNARVKTKDGVGTVIYNNLLKSTVTVRIEEGNEIKVNEYGVEDLVVIPKENIQQPKKNAPKEEKNVNINDFVEKKEISKPENNNDKKEQDRKPNKHFNKFKKKNKK